MKTILALIFILSCGKNINSSKKDYGDEDFDSIPNFLEVGNERYFAHYQLPEYIELSQVRIVLAEQGIPHTFYENTQVLARYEWMPLPSHQQKMSISIEPDLPSYLELILKDQGKTLPIKQLDINSDLKERLIKKTSYFEMRLKASSPISKYKVIKDYSNHEIFFTNDDLASFFQKIKRDVREINLIHLIQNEDLSQESNWLVKRESPQFFKIIYQDEENLLDDFNRKYRFQKMSLRRLNGQGQSLNIEAPLLIKMSASKTLQTRIAKREIYDPGHMPHERPIAPCHYYSYHAAQSGKKNLSSSEIYQELKHHHELTHLNLLDWNYMPSTHLMLKLNHLTSGFFIVGVPEAKCPMGVRPKLSRAQVNEELEIELIIETYVRRP